MKLGYRYEIYQDTAGQWRWRLNCSNGNVIADGAEGYATVANARRAIDMMYRVHDGELQQTVVIWPSDPVWGTK